ncbi:MAG: helicase-associated domain-containing protein [Planctomycetota bacterium]
MRDVKEYLHRRRKAELQTIHQFWFPGESRLGSRDELEQRVSQALAGGIRLQERVARLTRAQMAILSEILEHPGALCAVREVMNRLEESGIQRLEAESAVRLLVERGFLDRQRDGNGTDAKNDARGSGTAEQFFIPTELAERLREALDMGSARVAPARQLSQKRLSFDIDFERGSLGSLIAAIFDPRLRQLATMAVEGRGLVELHTPAVAEVMGTGDGIASALRSEWKKTLEEAEIGTLGSVSLKDFGIVVQEPALIIFQEWMRRHYELQLAATAEPDTVVEAGVDLYIDLFRLTSILQEQPISLTRDGKIPRRSLESLRQQMYVRRLEHFLESDPVETVTLLAQRLGLVESYSGVLRAADGDRLHAWRKLDLSRQAETIQQRFLEEHYGNRWSFHQESLREILLEQLKQSKHCSWISLDALVGAVVSTYLLELEEREVRESLRQRREDDFSRERLNSPFHRLGTDLTYWLVHRFLLLGLCELGLRGGKLLGFRLTPLGRQLLGLPQELDESRILVNPDFEIMLFSEGLRGMRLELQLARFGARTSAERVRRYRVTRESARDGIRSGLSLGEIRTLLEESSDYPLAEPILAHLKDWARDIDWVQVQAAVVLRGFRPSIGKELLAMLQADGVEHFLGNDGSIAILESASSAEAGVRHWLEKLKDRGLLVREALK